MNDTEAQQIWQRVRQDGQFDSRNPQRMTLHAFEQLVQQIGEEEKLSHLAPNELRMMIALCWLGPQDAGAPPAAMREGFFHFAQESLPTTELSQGRLIDLAIAFGCGVWRSVQPGDGRWEHRWQRALHWVTHHVLGWMKATAGWLHFDVQLPGYAFVAPFPTPWEAEALASLLWLGKCDCWRLREVDADLPLDRHAARRAARCLQEHRLAAWNPAAMSLADFIARAVKGDKAKGDRSSRKGFVSGAVNQGMFFCELYRESEVRFGKVLGWRCLKHPQDLCEWSECARCKDHGEPTIFAETRHTRAVTRRLLVKAPQGPYQEALYWHCQQEQCDTYYQFQHPACPRCLFSRTQGAAKSTVWIRNFADRRAYAASLNVPDNREERETRSAMREALAQLTDAERAVLIAIKVEGKSPPQVADELGMSVDQVKSRLKNALQKMKELLS